jgi:phosphate transport system permease protein
LSTRPQSIRAPLCVRGAREDRLPVTATDTWTASDNAPIAIVVRRSGADKIYRAVAYGAGSGTLLLMGLIGAFLLIKAWPALHQLGLHFFTTSAWTPQTAHFGIVGVLLGTVIIAVLALMLAVPVATLAALFITEYAPRRLRRPITGLVDLLAAVPSLIYGLWGRSFLGPRVRPLSIWLAHHLAFIPIFNSPHATSFSASAFIAGVVVALMIVPLCTAVMREVFAAAPPGEKEGALALGGTQWGVIRDVVLPFGRGGMIGGAMLGLGRALGETIAVTLIISPDFKPAHLIHILPAGGNSIASLIALKFGESAGGIGLSALMAAGLTLFMMTLVVNAIASTIVSRSRSGSATEI